MNEDTLKKGELATGEPEEELAVTEEEELGDSVPLTVAEAKAVGNQVKERAIDAAKDVAQRGKQAAAGPARRAGRTYMKTLRNAAEWLFEGLGTPKS